MSLKTWVNDQLHDLVDFADDQVVDYILAIAKKAKTPDSLMGSLRDEGVPDNAKSRQFAHNLLEKLPKKQASSSSFSQERKAALEARKRNEQYRTVLPPDEGDVIAAAPASAGQKRKMKDEGRERGEKKRDRKESKKRSIRKKTDEDNWKEDEEEEKMKKAKKEEREEVKIEEQPEEEQMIDEEQKRIDEDRQRAREVAEFEARLHERDKKKTKKVGGVSEASENMKRRKEMELEEREKLLPMLRKISRQAYVKKREPQKLRALQEEIEDEINIFGEEDLTAEEKKEIEYKKRMFALVSEAKEAQSKMDTILNDSYKLPTGEFNEDGRIDKEKKMEILSRYQNRFVIFFCLFFFLFFCFFVFFFVFVWFCFVFFEQKNLFF